MFNLLYLDGLISDANADTTAGNITEDNGTSAPNVDIEENPEPATEDCSCLFGALRTLHKSACEDASENMLF